MSCFWLKRGCALVSTMLIMAGCAGGENLYAGPMNDFEQAVGHTAQVTRIYSTLAHQEQNDVAISALVVDAKAAIGFDVTACAKGHEASSCAITNSAHKPVVADATAVSPTVQMMAQIENYAARLSDIAGAVSEAELQARQKAADSAIDKLQSGAKALKSGQNQRGLNDFKSIAEDALASAYLQSQRRKLLIAVVKDADPLIVSSAKMLSSVLGDVRSSYLETQSFRINLQVLNFNNLAPLLTVDGSASAQASAQVLRRESLSRLIHDSHQAQTVASLDIGLAFDNMAKAHAALLKALEFSVSNIGTLVEAIENFNATAKKASNTLSTLQGMM